MWASVGQGRGIGQQTYAAYPALESKLLPCLLRRCCCAALVLLVVAQAGWEESGE